jgi:metal-responsive CopG/Arc/MetJ family transcriptional regulator
MSKITVLLAEAEFARFDAYCEERGFKKSTLISRLIREYLDSEQYPLQTCLDFERNKNGSETVEEK